MINWREVIVIEQERRQELLREAEKQRLVRQQALVGRETQDGIRSRMLTWVGRHLVAWGCFLERRYGIPAEARTAPGVSGCR